MKAIASYFWAIYLLLSGSIQAQDLNKGLIAWYTFDGNTRDASTYANHGTPHNITYSSGKCGQPNSAAYLNGTNAYVNLPLNTALNGKKQLTITAWVKPVRFNNIQYTLKSVYSHWVDYDTRQPVGVLFGVSPDSSVVNAFSGGYQVSSTYNVVRSNEWQLIALLYDGSKTVPADRATFQVNCQSYNSICDNNYSNCAATPTSIGTIANYTYIGTRKNDLGKFVDYFEGYIDEIRIYDRLLTKDELNNLFLVCGPPPCDDNNDSTEDTYNVTTCSCEHNPNSSKPGVYFPSSFTPNKDGINDTYRPIYKGVGTALLRVYDRWGEIIFQSDSLTDGWDGAYRGLPCMQGIYNYKITGSYTNGEEFIFHGSIFLIR